MASEHPDGIDCRNDDTVLRDPRHQEPVVLPKDTRNLYRLEYLQVGPDYGWRMVPGSITYDLESNSDLRTVGDLVVWVRSWSRLPPTAKIRVTVSRPTDLTGPLHSGGFRQFNTVVYDETDNNLPPFLWVEMLLTFELPQDDWSAVIQAWYDWEVVEKPIEAALPAGWELNEIDLHGTMQFRVEGALHPSEALDVKLLIERVLKEVAADARDEAAQDGEEAEV